MTKTNILRSLLIVAAVASAAAHAAGKLVVSDGWIRTPPPGMPMLAGYATLRNAGDAPLTVIGASSEAFGAVSLHETVRTNGVERMRPLGALTIAPAQSVAFAPGGKHLMLMRPKHVLAAGDKVSIRFDIAHGAALDADFVVRDAAPGAH